MLVAQSQSQGTCIVSRDIIQSFVVRGEEPLSIIFKVNISKFKSFKVLPFSSYWHVQMTDMVISFSLIILWLVYVIIVSRETIILYTFF